MMKKDHFKQQLLLWLQVPFKEFATLFKASGTLTLKKFSLTA